MLPLRALPATGANNNAHGALAKNTNLRSSAAAGGAPSSSSSSAARRAALLLLASPAVIAHGGEDLLLTVARLLRGVASRGRDLGGGSAEWAYDLLPDSDLASTTSKKANGATNDADDDDAEKQRRASSSAAASSLPSTSGRAVAEAWRTASGALTGIGVGERDEKGAFFLHLVFHLSATARAPTFALF